MPFSLSTIEEYYRLIAPKFTVAVQDVDEDISMSAIDMPSSEYDNTQDEYQGNKLHLAVFRENLEAIKKILSEEPSMMYQPDNYDIPPIAYALCTKNRTSILNLFFKNHFFDIEKDLVEGNRLLHFAVQSKSDNAKFAQESSLVDFLIEHNANINQENDQNQSPLYLASQCGTVDTLRYLLKHNANIQLTPDGKSPLSIVSYNHDHEKMNELEKKAKEIIGNLLQAIKVKNANTVAEIFTRHSAIDFKVKDNKNRNLMHYACASGNSDIIFLVKEKYPCLLTEPDLLGKLPFEFCPAESPALKAVVLGNTLTLIGENPLSRTAVEFNHAKSDTPQSVQLIFHFNKNEHKLSQGNHLPIGKLEMTHDKPSLPDRHTDKKAKH